MRIPKPFLFTLLFAVFINNLVWLLLYENLSIPSDVYTAELLPPAEFDCALTARTYNNAKPANSKILNTGIAEQGYGDDTQVTAISVTTAGFDALHEQQSPLELDSGETDIRRVESQTFISSHNLAKDYYFSAGTMDKLQTIQSLSPLGDDLALINEILLKEDNSALRTAAVSRLTYEHSFAATNTLINALDDPAAEVRLRALNTIVKNADRSLAPLLRDKMEALPYGSVRDEYEKLIRQLEYSVAMSMDELPGTSSY